MEGGGDSAEWLSRHGERFFSICFTFENFKLYVQVNQFAEFSGIIRSSSIIQENSQAALDRQGSAYAITDEAFARLSSEQQRKIYRRHTIHLVASGTSNLLPEISSLTDIDQMNSVFDILTQRPVHGEYSMYSYGLYAHHVIRSS